MKITGNTVGTTMPRANYNQTDPSKADFIIGRDNILGRDELSSATEDALRQAKEGGEFDGTSVTITNISESTEDGGSNVVTFSDGNTMSVKNGSKGSEGDSALIVTGNPACREMVTSNENSATYKAQELGFIEEIADAHLSGQEVFIYLRTPTANMATTIKGTNLPTIRYVDARVDGVYKPVDGETHITAHGIGWSLDGGSMYKVKITAFDDYTLLDVDLHTPFDATAKPLIVTGKFPASWSSSSNGAVAVTSNGMDLSHTEGEICEAFKEGRDVLIRLTNTDPNYEFGNWNMNYAELQVQEAEADTPAVGHYAIKAFGTGYATDSFGKAESTPMKIFTNSQLTFIATPVKKADSSPLIVTGKFPTTEMTMSGVAQASIDNMALSHTLDKMVEAFQAGRDVLIRLNAVTPGMDDFGGWKFRCAELRVSKAQIYTAGHYDFFANGMGYTAFDHEAAPLSIRCQLSNNAQIFVRVKE